MNTRVLKNADSPCEREVFGGVLQACCGLSHGWIAGLARPWKGRRTDISKRRA